MSVRRRLLRDAFLVLAVYLAIHAVADVRGVRHRLGRARLLRRLVRRPLRGPARVGRRLQLQPAVRPGHLAADALPWAVFCAVFVGAAALGIAWLVRPLPLVLAVGAWLACLPEILSGNIFWLLAVMAVVGFSHASAWCVAAFTKVLPCLGPVWFLARGEWRRLATLRRDRPRAAQRVSVLISPQALAGLGRLPADQRRRLVRADLPVPRGHPLPPGGPASRWPSWWSWWPPGPTGRGWCRSRWCSRARSSGGAPSPCWPRSPVCRGLGGSSATTGEPELGRRRP